MSLELVLRYVHFVSIFAIVGALVSEHVLLRKTIARAEVARLARIDAIYGIAALTLLAAGFTLWLGGIGKPAEFYSRNWIFHTKISLFALVGILSIYPTIFFLKNRKGNPDDRINVPSSVLLLLRIELGLIAFIPLLAGLMARGIGLSD